MSVPIIFSQHVLSRYQPERGDRLLFLITQIADELGIDIETIADYLTPRLVDMLKYESKNFNLLEDDPLSEQTYDLF